MEEKINRKIILSTIFLIILLIVIIIMGFFIYKLYKDKQISKRNTNELNIEGKQLLIEKSYHNSAWGFRYNGMAIFNDGTIYSWDYTDNRHFTGELKNLILEKGNLENKKVSAEDLEKIKEYINNIEDTLEIEYQGMDMGEEKVSVWNSSGKEIKLSVKGDGVGENKTKNAQELLKIIDKYL